MGLIGHKFQEMEMMADQPPIEWHDPLEISIVAWPAIVAGLYGRLTSRELDVALAVAEGRSNRDIATRLFISQKTVEYHLGTVFGSSA